MDLPQPIRDFILALTEDTLSPAYMLVNETTLAQWGGDLESYGVTEMEKGLDVTERVPFLTGLLPLGESSAFLPRVQTREGVFADIYIFGREYGTWVLLLDATAQIASRSAMQQRLFDSKLESSDLRKESKALLNANIVLENLVQERTADLMQTILQLKQQLAENQRVRKAAQEDS